ncbi:MAG: tautomerase family protein [Desulforegulaceae bacterium]|nr:tautomerase family protein [Desulforegulaceae bacterium]
MPHIIVKMYPGRSLEQKQEFALKITDEAVKILGCSADSVSVAIEEIEQENWKYQVYYPDIEEKKETLYKKPGYSF